MGSCGGVWDPGARRGRWGRPWRRGWGVLDREQPRGKLLRNRDFGLQLPSGLGASSGPSRSTAGLAITSASSRLQLGSLIRYRQSILSRPAAALNPWLPVWPLSTKATASLITPIKSNGWPALERAADAATPPRVARHPPHGPPPQTPTTNEVPVLTDGRRVEAPLRGRRPALPGAAPLLLRTSEPHQRLARVPTTSAGSGGTAWGRASPIPTRQRACASSSACRLRSSRIWASRRRAVSTAASRRPPVASRRWRGLSGGLGPPQAGSSSLEFLAKVNSKPLCKCKKLSTLGLRKAGKGLTVRAALPPSGLGVPVNPAICNSPQMRGATPHVRLDGISSGSEQARTRARRSGSEPQEVRASFVAREPEAKRALRPRRKSRLMRAPLPSTHTPRRLRQADRARRGRGEADPVVAGSRAIPVFLPAIGDRPVATIGRVTVIEGGPVKVACTAAAPVRLHFACPVTLLCARKTGL